MRLMTMLNGFAFIWGCLSVESVLELLIVHHVRDFESHVEFERLIEFSIEADRAASVIQKRHAVNQARENELRSKIVLNRHVIFLDKQTLAVLPLEERCVLERAGRGAVNRLHRRT